MAGTKSASAVAIERIGWLVIAGLISGALTCALIFLWVYVGAVFGVVISTQMWLTERVRSLPRTFGFTVASTVAYFVAMEATMGLPPLLGIGLDGGRGANFSLPPFFIGGTIGALIVAVAFRAFLSPEGELDALIARMAAIALCGGALGALGFGLGQTLFHNSPNSAFFSLYLVWQTGIAASFVLLMPAPVPVVAALQRPVPLAQNFQPAQRKGELPVGAKVLMILIVLGLGAIIAEQVQGWRQGRRVRAALLTAEQHESAAMPSKNNLPALQPLTADQVLILRPIADHAPERPMQIRVPTDPPRMNYILGYEDLPDGLPTQQSFAAVTVSLFPNAAWANFESRNVLQDNSVELDAHYITAVSKFGSHVIMNTMMRSPDGSGTLEFYWVSGNELILISFYQNEDDEFIREYLQLHPSSL